VEEVDLETLARQTIDLLSETEGGAVELSVARDDPRGLVVEGEQVMLGQLLTNLLLNALSWGAGEPVKVRLTHDAEHCSVTVFDQGPGIDPAIADRIFEPFVSGRSSTGLGLAVSLGIAHQHGGTIEASNRESGGARFALRLPRSFSPPRDSTTPARAEPPVS
jgi:signal transduction histidine kinase